MAYKFQMSTAKLSGTMEPTDDGSFNLGSSTKEWQDLYIDGTAHIDAINYNGTLVTATAAELNYLDNDALTAADITKLAAVDATAAEINYLDNDDLTAADLQKLADVTATATELNYVDTTAGTGAASKALILDGSRDVDTINALGIAAMANNWTNAGNTVADMGSLTTVDINGGSVDGATIGAAAQSSGQFTTLSASSTLDVAGAARFGTENQTTVSGVGILSSSAANTVFKTTFDRVVVGDADINGGAVDGTVIGAASAAAGTFTTMTATTSNLGALGAAVDCANQNLTNVDINSGAVDGAIIGAASAAAGTFTVLTANTSIMPDANDGAVLGAAGTAFSDLFLAEGAVINWDSGDATLTQASDVVTLAGATFTATLTNSLAKAGNSGLAMTTYNGSAAVSDLAIDLADLGAAAVAVAADSIAFVDATDGSTKKESIVDLATAMAGAGITATNGVFSTDAGGLPNSLIDGETLTEGFNYATGSASTLVFMPVGGDFGDQITVKNNSTGVLTIDGYLNNTIDGESGAGAIVLDSPYAAVKLVYASSGSWAIV